MTYQPNPIDTSKVILDSEYLQLTELLAKNTHEIWAKQRLNDGWTYGKTRNDRLKQHPGLVPYEELSELEKEYDRLTTLGVIKTLLALGYKIEGNQISTDSQKEEAELLTILNNLVKTGEIDILSLLNIQRKTLNIQCNNLIIYQILAQASLELGEYLIGYDIIKEALKKWPEDLKLKQLLAMALVRSGATEKANIVLTELVEKGNQDQETLSLLGRTYKDLAKQSKNPDVKQQQLALAAQKYQQAYQKSQDTYPGINAATLTFISGDRETGEAIARQIKEKCQVKLPLDEEITSEDYWTLATLGEACLVLQQWSESQKWYRHAVKITPKRYGDHCSTRSNAKLLLEYLESSSEYLLECFDIPRIAVFTGHLIDTPNRREPRFPPHLETQVYQAIRQKLEEHNIQFGYSSAACGSDILFLEAVLERSGEIHIVLPYPEAEFRRDCVDVISGSNWGERFSRLLQQASSVNVAVNSVYEEDTSIYKYTHSLLHGLAKMRSQNLDTELVPMAVWDENPGNSLGGTATMVKTWHQRGYKVEIIHPQFLEPSKLIFNKLSIKATKHRPIRAILFADVVKFSRLNEQQVTVFIEHFLGTIANLETEKGYRSVMKNTWGDALYYIFYSVADAGSFALDMCNLINSIDWTTKGLPEDLNLRISLHAGPVYPYINPITREYNYTGNHVTYAARIESITPPGKVYCSQEFAAISCAENVQSYCCDYVGQIPLAKKYGTLPLYHLYENFSNK